MVVVGADVHKRSHTFVAVDAVGKQLGQLTVDATTKGHHKALAWVRKSFPGRGGVGDRGLPAPVGPAGAGPADRGPAGGAGAAKDDGDGAGVGADPREVGPDRCVSGRPRVPARTRPSGGVARRGIAGAEVAGGPAGVVGEHQDSNDQQFVVAGPRTRSGACAEAAVAGPGQASAGVAVLAAWPGRDRRGAGIGRTRRRDRFDLRIKGFHKRITKLVEKAAPTLLAMPGCGELTAAKLVGESAGITRFTDRGQVRPPRRRRPHPGVVGQHRGPGPDDPYRATGNSTPRCTGSRSPRSA